MLTWELISNFSFFLHHFHFMWFSGQKSPVSPFFLQFFVFDFLTALSINRLNNLILGRPVGLFRVNFISVALVYYLSYQQSIWLSCGCICGRGCVLNAAIRQLLPRFSVRRFQLPVLSNRLSNLTEKFYGFCWSVQGTRETVPQIRLLFLVHFINLLLDAMYFELL